MQSVSEKESEIQAVNSPSPPVKLASQPTVKQVVIPQKIAPKTPVTSPTPSTPIQDSGESEQKFIAGTKVPAPIGGSPRVVKQVIIPRNVVKSPSSALNNRRVVFRRSDSGRPAAELIQKTFTEHGLWLRSVQTKNCQCLTEKDLAPDEKTRSVAGMYADSWSYAHPTIAQYLFKMHPDEGKRGFGLIIDWTKTADRYVEYALKDMSSNKRFLDKQVAKSPEETEQDMTAIRQALAGLKKIEHNEVRSCQVRKESLVGLIWNPVLYPTILTEGGKTWEESKPLFESFVKTLQQAGAAQKGLPIFAYEVSGGMTLSYLDFIA